MSGRGFSRRAVAISGSIAVALGLAAIGIEIPRLIGRTYRKTPYDDLLDLLTDRETAARLGRDVHAEIPAFDPKAVAVDLRDRLEHHSLGQVVDADIAQGLLAEAAGWVLPRSLAELAALAATEG